jgi:hypothetical protein
VENGRIVAVRVGRQSGRIEVTITVLRHGQNIESGLMPRNTIHNMMSHADQPHNVFCNLVTNSFSTSNSPILDLTAPLAQFVCPSLTQVQAQKAAIRKKARCD